MNKAKLSGREILQYLIDNGRLSKLPSHVEFLVRRGDSNLSFTWYIDTETGALLSIIGSARCTTTYNSVEYRLRNRAPSSPITTLKSTLKYMYPQLTSLLEGSSDGDK